MVMTPLLTVYVPWKLLVDPSVSSESTRAVTVFPETDKMSTATATVVLNPLTKLL